MKEYPHVPAAFINSIADEGSKREAVEWLQRTWNELCALRGAVKYADECLRYGEGIGLLYYMDAESEHGKIIAEAIK